MEEALRVGEGVGVGEEERLREAVRVEEREGWGEGEAARGVRVAWALARAVEDGEVL